VCYALFEILVCTYVCVALFFRRYYLIRFIKLKRYVYDDVRFLYLILILASISWQQSPMNWLHKGDANSNSKFFHRHANVISTILVDGVIVEGVDELSSAIFFPTLVLTLKHKLIFVISSGLLFFFFKAHFGIISSLESLFIRFFVFNCFSSPQELLVMFQFFFCLIRFSSAVRFGFLVFFSTPNYNQSFYSYLYLNDIVSHLFLYDMAFLCLRLVISSYFQIDHITFKIQT